MRRPPGIEPHGNDAAKAVREGRLSRASGLPRQHNPYDDPQIEGGQRQLRHAWWSGWDEADAELNTPTSDRGRRR